MILETILKSNIWNISNEIVKFPQGLVQNFSESVYTDKKELTIHKSKEENFVYMEKMILIYKKVHYFSIKNIGSFMSYINAFLENTLLGIDGKASAELTKLMTMDDMKVNLLLISKLFSLNNYNILREDPNLFHYEFLKNCFEYVANNMSSIIQSPCYDLIKNPICKSFCEWHKKLITKDLSKGELFTLMQ